MTVDSGSFCIQSPQCWDYRYLPPFLAVLVVFCLLAFMFCFVESGSHYSPGWPVAPSSPISASQVAEMTTVHHQTPFRQPDWFWMTKLRLRKNKLFFKFVISPQCFVNLLWHKPFPTLPLDFSLLCQICLCIKTNYSSCHRDQRSCKVRLIYSMPVTLDEKNFFCSCTYSHSFSGCWGRRFLECGSLELVLIP